MAGVQSPDTISEVEEEEEIIDLADEAVQTTSIEMTTSSSQTESIDPPPYDVGAESSKAARLRHVNERFVNRNSWAYQLYDAGLQSTYASTVVRLVPDEMLQHATSLVLLTSLAYLAGYLTGSFRICRHDKIWLAYNSFGNEHGLHSGSGIAASFSFWLTE